MARKRLTPVPRPAKPRRTGKDKPPAAAAPNLGHITPSLRACAVPISDVAFMAGNPLLHSPEQIEDLKASLRTYGQVDPLIVNRHGGTSTVIGGNGRLAGMLSLGWGWVAVTYVDLEPAKANALAVVLNRTPSREWDAQALDVLLRDVNVGGEERLDQMLAGLAAEVGMVPGEARSEPQAPEEFQAFDENIETQHTCPKCGYEWSGGKEEAK